MDTNSQSDIVADVRNVSKKYCRQLHRSLRYGLSDLCRATVGLSPPTKLRKEEFYAIQDVSFQIRRGESVALLGPNGAGKTTMMKMLNGLLRPDEGDIRIKGRVGALTQLGAGFNMVLSGRENIFINGAVLGLSRGEIRERFDEIVDFSEIGYAIDDPVKNYSSGMRARLGYSIAALLEPELLLMDEVLATGDKRFKHKCFNHISSMNQRGVSVVIVSHAVGRLVRLCQRAVVFADGKMQFAGPIRQGVQLYEDILQLKKLETPLLKVKDQVSHDIAWVDGIEIINSRGKATSNLRHGEQAVVRVHLNSSRPLDYLRVNLMIDGAGGTICRMLSGKEKLKLDGEQTHVDLSIPKLPLLKGSYMITARLIGRASNEVFHERKTPIRVKSRGNIGYVKIKHRWNFNSDD